MSYKRLTVKDVVELKKSHNIKLIQGATMIYGGKGATDRFTGNVIGLMIFRHTMSLETTWEYIVDCLGDEEHSGHDFLYWVDFAIDSNLGYLRGLEAGFEEMDMPTSSNAATHIGYLDGKSLLSLVDEDEK